MEKWESELYLETYKITETKTEKMSGESEKILLSLEY